MFNSRAALFGTLLFVVASFAHGQKFSAQQIYKTYASSVVTLDSEIKTGTGFIDSNFRVYTCFHVIDGATKVTVKFSDGQIRTASTVIALDRTRDIAVLELDETAEQLKADQPMRKAAKELNLQFGDYAKLGVGEKVVVLGSPLGLDGSITEGLVSAKRQMKGFDNIQLSASISPGSSGSPVFGEDGKVVGMVTSALNEGQSLNFAIGCNELLRVTSVRMSDIRTKSFVVQAIENEGHQGHLLAGMFGGSINIAKDATSSGGGIQESSIENPVKKFFGENKLEFLTKDQQDKLLVAKDPEDNTTLLFQDAARTSFDFTTYTEKATGGKMNVSVKLSVFRGAILAPTVFQFVAVYYDAQSMVVPRGGNIDNAVSECVKTILARFKIEFKKDNS